MGSHSPERPAGLQHRLHPPQGARKFSGSTGQSLRAQLAGGLPRVPAREHAPSPSPHQLAPNSPTPRLSQSCRGRGSRQGAGRTIAAREGEALGPGGSAAPGRIGKSREKVGARDVQRSAAERERSGAERAAGRARGRRRRRHPPCGGGAVVEAGSPAGERRKCRGVGAGPAPRQLLLAELLPPPGGRADARSRGPRGRAGGARRG